VNRFPSGLRPLFTPHDFAFSNSAHLFEEDLLAPRPLYSLSVFLFLWCGSLSSYSFHLLRFVVFSVPLSPHRGAENGCSRSPSSIGPTWPLPRVRRNPRWFSLRLFLTTDIPPLIFEVYKPIQLLRRRAVFALGVEVAFPYGVFFCSYLRLIGQLTACPPPDNSPPPTISSPSTALWHEWFSLTLLFSA